MYGEDVVAPLKQQPVNRFDEISDQVVNLDAAAIVEFSIRKWLRDKEQLVDRIKLNVATARGRSLLIGSRQEHADATASEVTQVIELYRGVERSIRAKNAIFCSKAINAPCGSAFVVKTGCAAP